MADATLLPWILDCPRIVDCDPCDKVITDDPEYGWGLGVIKGSIGIVKEISTAGNPRDPRVGVGFPSLSHWNKAGDVWWALSSELQEPSQASLQQFKESLRASKKKSPCYKPVTGDTVILGPGPSFCLPT